MAWASIYGPGCVKTHLKLFIVGYLKRVQSSRRLEREAGRNVELIWLLGRLAPDFKTIADFRKDNTLSILSACRQAKQWWGEAAPTQGTGVITVVASQGDYCDLDVPKSFSHALKQ
jgi:hypothetical protein